MRPWICSTCWAAACCCSVLMGRRDALDLQGTSLDLQQSTYMRAAFFSRPAARIARPAACGHRHAARVARTCIYSACSQSCSAHRRRLSAWSCPTARVIRPAAPSACAWPRTPFFCSLCELSGLLLVVLLRAVVYWYSAPGLFVSLRVDNCVLVVDRLRTHGSCSLRCGLS